MPPSTPRPPVSGPDSGPEHPFPIRLSGPVIKGFGRGSKELGIPTANIPIDGLGDDVLPAELGVGVYYGVVALDPGTSSSSSSSPAQMREAEGAKILPAVLSIGYNPFYKNKTRSIEIHILPSLSSPSPTAEPAAGSESEKKGEEARKVKFNKLPDFYGTKLNLLMLGYIRPEYDYVSVEALVEDIRVDCEVARASLLRDAYRVYLDEGEDGDEAKLRMTSTSYRPDPVPYKGELKELVSSNPLTVHTIDLILEIMDRLIKGFRRRSSSHRPSKPPLRRLYVISHTPTFDPSSLSRFEAEGFTVEYLSFSNESDDIRRDRRELEVLIHGREDDLEPGERYAIVAYHRPAYLLLLSHHQHTNTNPFPRLCAFVTLYPELPKAASLGSQKPSRLPPSTTAASASTSAACENVTILPIQIHLAGTQNPGLVLWDDVDKRHQCHIFFYPESKPGFAESFDPEAYDRISARLAWSRALECIKRGFGWPCGGGDWGSPEPEIVWEGYWRNVYDFATQWLSTEASSPDMLSLMVEGGAAHPHYHDRMCVNCVPSGIGGSSPAQIVNFYSTQFLPAGPPSQQIRLLSRTSGPDRVVDELLLTFEHTEEIPWLLPGVPPTGRSVHIPLVMAASFLAGKIARHNIYWDQASVLVQIGLLDPTLIPAGFQATGPNREGKNSVERIPLVGEEAITSVLN
ncbi:dienelactone hydrolase [Aspergillus lucknowensis]|uniref:riboflavin kinase n=1 Tax=Aspergillus lucknowensis TaxID=176173 RepID=A0ABR4LPD0_9EURO